MKKFSLLLIISLLLAAPTARAQQEQVIDGIVAVVGQTIIKISDIENSYAQIRLRQGIENGLANRCELLENMLISKLMVHKGMIDSVKVTDEEVEDQVQYYLKAYVNQYGSKEALRKATGFTYDEMHDQFFDMLHDRIISQRVEYELTQNVKVTPAEVALYFNEIPKDSLPTIDDQYEVSEITIHPAISEAERDRVRGELAKLRERVMNGEKFSMLAALYSEDPGSASKGGELGFKGRGVFVSDFEAAAFALKPGEVSPIIETPFGFHILQLIERRGNTVNCRHILMMPKISSQDMLSARMKLDSIATQVRLGNITFAEAAKKYSDGNSRVQGGVVSNAQAGNNKFTKENLAALYPNISIAAMKEGDVSNATQIKDDEQKDVFCLVHLDKKHEAHVANLTDDYDRIYNAAMQRAKNEKIIDWCNRMIKTTYIRIADEYKECPNFRVNWPVK